MKKNKDDQSFNNLSEGDFNKKWDERAKVLKNPKKIEEKKVNKSKIKNDNRMSLFDKNNYLEKLYNEAINNPNSIFYKGNKKNNENGSINKNNEDEENEIINNAKKDETKKIIIKTQTETTETNGNINKDEKDEEYKEEYKIEKEKERINKIRNENEYENKEIGANSSQTQTNGTYLMKWLLIILGLLLIGGGIALFLTASALVFKFLAISLGLLGAVGFGIGLFYNKIVDRYRKEPEPCCFRFWTYTIFEPKEKNKENDINPEKGKDNFINEDENIL
ncbi:MAG: hypothetical protein IJU86_04615 [Firmicutes bacterium]|nr:hypothetical protein [Bacillota bacterium]